jgi:Tol biopolymer transport system component
MGVGQPAEPPVVATAHGRYAGGGPGKTPDATRSHPAYDRRVAGRVIRLGSIRFARVWTGSPIARVARVGVLASALAAGLVSALGVAVGSAAKNDTVLISRASGTEGAKGDARSDVFSISADGRFVAFITSASNLHRDDSDDAFDVFVRDLKMDRTVLVSRASGPAGAKGNATQSNGINASISANGRFVAFDSAASNLDPDDTDTDPDVFVRDLETAETVLVSRASGTDGAKSNINSNGVPSISADGRLVAFNSYSTNLHPDDTDSDSDVFVRDLETDETVLISRATGANGSKANGGSYDASISANGRFVTFSSGAPNLDPDDSDSKTDMFVRDLQSDSTLLVSRASGSTGTNGNGHAQLSSLSADGRYVAFGSLSTNLDPDDRDPDFDVFVRDLHSDTTELVSRASGLAGAKGNGPSFGIPSISADGRLVAFDSTASNLHPYDSDSDSDVFVRDLAADTTVLVSRASGAAGAKGNRRTMQGLISGDGRFVTFSSDASNLHPDDRDDKSDVFLRRLGAPPLPGPPRLFCYGRRASSVVLPRSARLVGSPHADVIVGSTGADTIDGRGGNDRICGRGGRDDVRGGRGSDRLLGGAGNDRLRGGRGNDLLEGAAGNDAIDGRAGRDRIVGGSGDDTVPTAGTFRDRVDCGLGRDVVIVDPLDRVLRCEHRRFRAPG